MYGYSTASKFYLGESVMTPEHNGIKVLAVDCRSSSQTDKLKDNKQVVLSRTRG